MIFFYKLPMNSNIDSFDSLSVTFILDTLACKGNWYQYVCNTPSDAIKVCTRYNYVNIQALVSVFWATHNDKITIPAELGTKVGFGVLVNESLFKQLNDRHRSLLKYLYTIHRINLFGSNCLCNTTCPNHRLFLAPLLCQEIIQRFILLNNLIIPDVARLICKNWIH